MKRILASLMIAGVALIGGAAVSSAAGASCYELPVGSFVNGKFVPNPEFQACLAG